MRMESEQVFWFNFVRIEEMIEDSHLYSSALERTNKLAYIYH